MTNLTVPTKLAVNVIHLLDAATAPIIGAPVFDQPSLKAFDAILVGTGAVTAVINILGSNFDIPEAYKILGTITLNGTGSATDGFIYEAPWGFIKAQLVSISGTGAQCSVALGKPPANT